MVNAIESSWFKANVRRYATGLSVPALAFVLTRITEPWLGSVAFFFYYPAVLFVGWRGGVGPGLLALLLSDALILSEFLREGPLAMEQALQIIAFTALNLLAVALTTLLRRSEERAERILETMSDGLVVVDRHWKIVYINRQAAATSGGEPKDYIGRPLWNRFPEGETGPFGQAHRRAVRENRVVRIEDYFAPLKRWFQSTIQPTPEGLIIAFHDVTERKQAELGLAQLNDQLERKVEERTRELLRAREVLHESQKLEAVGRLAGGIAHDFNNLITGIRGIAQEVRDLKPKGCKESKDMDDIIQAAERATTLTRQLLAFSRQQIHKPLVISLNHVIAEMNSLLGRLIGEHIDLVSILHPGLRSVKVDPGQVEQILLNLSLNARDAMQNGGRLVIETANADVDEDMAPLHPGRYAVLTVSDTGQGIDEGVKEHIFEPFYSTKPRDKGTGLGLATVYGIVKQNGGEIFVYSTVGVGTSFKIYLPAVEAGMETRESLLPPAVKGRGETVLIVEDEDLVRRVAGRALIRNGYRVLDAPDGKTALELANRYPEPIDLLFTDVVMPGMNGRQLADALRAKRPGVRVLYTSGFTENIIVIRGMLKPGIAFIQKSFSSDELSRKVREVLDGPALVA